MNFFKPNNKNILGLSINLGKFSNNSIGKDVNDLKDTYPSAELNVIEKNQNQGLGSEKKWNNTATKFSSSLNPALGIKKLKKKQGTTLPLALEIWGLGYEGRVCKWNGSAWYEPNPNARLNQVDLGNNRVMGVGYSGRVFVWDSPFNTWVEPIANADVSQLSHLYLFDAWGISSATGKVVHSDGTGWYPVNNAPDLDQISAGPYPYVFGLKNNEIYLYDGSFFWFLPNTNARLTYISAGKVPGVVWGIGYNNRIFKSQDNGASWDEPNPNAGLMKITALDDLNAWGIGYNNRVFRTTDGGLGWEEPNPETNNNPYTGAHLSQISIGYA